MLISQGYGNAALALLLVVITNLVSVLVLAADIILNT
jgi:hypothetical protein